MTGGASRRSDPDEGLRMPRALAAAVRRHCGRRGSLMLFARDYPTAGHVEIYAEQSRHWVVTWLWFLS